METHLDGLLLGLVGYQLPLGVVGLDARGRVVSRNHAARAILDERDGLMLAQHRLVATRRHEAIELGSVIAGIGAPDGVGGTVRISRSSPRRPVTLFVAPLRWSSLPRPVDTPAALVVMSDPDREPPPREDMLERLYRLTRSEAEVALLVLDGARVEEVARRRGTSLNTTRTHLKRVFGKVGVQSQAELVRVLLAGPGPALLLLFTVMG